MNGAEALVGSLERLGVKRIFGIPGEENIHVVEALRHSGIELVLTRHEQAAGFMAATHGRLTGEIGVCMSTLGPGATNLVTAAAYAQLGGFPMLMLTGQKPIGGSKQGRFQILDVVAMMAPLCKYTRRVESAGYVPAITLEAARNAVTERAGAAHVELPEDIAQEHCTEGLLDPHAVPIEHPDPPCVESAARALRRARHPILVVGAAANRQSCVAAIRRLVERTRIPVVSTQMGKGVIDERCESFVGVAALSDRDLVHRSLAAADLILNVGHDPVEKPPFIMAAGGSPVIHVNAYGAEIDPIYFPGIEVVGDIDVCISALDRELGDDLDWDVEAAGTVRTAVEQHILACSADRQFPYSPQRLVAETRAAIPDDGVLTLDNGMYKIWFARNYGAYEPRTLLLDNALATMGAGLPSSIAAALECPQRPVVSLSGDGGFMMNSQELETATRLGLDLVAVVVRDDAYGMIRWKQAVAGLVDHGLQFGNPDFVAYADAYGATGHRVTESRPLEAVLVEAIAAGGVHLIEVPISYHDTTQILGQEISGLADSLDVIG